MSEIYEFKRGVHPSKHVWEYLIAWIEKNFVSKDLTLEELHEIFQICEKEKPITEENAKALEKMFNRPARFWVEAQRLYDELPRGEI